jgi:hypothetical protein
MNGILKVELLFQLYDSLTLAQLLEAQAVHLCNDERPSWPYYIWGLGSKHG